MNKIKISVLCFLCMVILSGCGKEEALDEYQADMTTFFEHIVAYNDGMNAIDASSEDAVGQLLAYLDQLRDEITWMAGLEVPEQFSAAESLADEADENMKQAVELYHRAYEGEFFDEALAQAAREYYDRANIRIQYILTILHGEIPEGEGVTYTEESSILGGGYLNRDDEEEAETDTDTGTDAGQEVPPDSGQSLDEPAEGSSGDNYDTDDTEFYVE